MAAVLKGSVLIYGGCGGLGSIVVTKFKEARFKVVSVDFRESPNADLSVIIKGGSKEDVTEVVKKLKDHKYELDGVISVAGGFTMGTIKDESIFDSLNKMWSFNVQSAVAASHVASHMLKPGGLLVLTGAQAALSPTPGMLAYGITKAATHHLVSSLAKDGSGMPPGSSVAAILPITLDTPQNRKDMPTADFNNWTPVETVADVLVNWVSGKDRPKNGSMIQIKTVKSKTEFIPV